MDSLHPAPQSGLPGPLAVAATGVIQHLVPDTPAWPLGAAVPQTVTEATEPEAGSSDQPRRAPALFPRPTPARSPPQSGSVGRGDGRSQDGHRPTGSQRGPSSLPILTLGPPVCTRPSPTPGWAASLQTLPWLHLRCSALTGRESGNPEPRFSASQSLSSGRRFSASGSPFPAPPLPGPSPSLAPWLSSSPPGAPSSVGWPGFIFSYLPSRVLSLALELQVRAGVWPPADGLKSPALDLLWPDSSHFLQPTVI